VTAGRSETITFFGCGNAAGNSIPPYFVYPGKKMQSRWMDGSTPGAVGTVSDSVNNCTKFIKVLVDTQFIGTFDSCYFQSTWFNNSEIWPSFQKGIKPS
jgi:hypothetical protein